MFPTRRGIAFLLVAATLYGMAWATQIGWFYAAAAVVLAILLVNLPLPWLSLRGLSAERLRPTAPGRNAPDLYEDDTVHLAIVLRNRSMLPKFLLTLVDDCPLASPTEGEQAFLVTSVGPRGSSNVAYEVRCHRRGVYDFEPVLVESSAPFGLFRAYRQLPAPLQVTVYPQLLPMGTAHSRGYAPGGVVDAVQPQTTGDLRGVRDYRPGDQARTVHWRASARRGQLVVKELDDPREGDVRLAFNPGFDLGQGRESTLEYSVKIAASVAWQCLRTRRAFQMWPASQQTAREAWRGTLEHLARLEVHEQAAVQDLLRYRGGPSSVILIVSAADGPTLDEITTNAAALRRATVVVLEGFGPGEYPQAGVRLANAGMEVAICRPGGLPGALASLGAAMVVPAGQRGWPRTAVLHR